MRAAQVRTLKRSELAAMNALDILLAVGLASFLISLVAEHNRIPDSVRSRKFPFLPSFRIVRREEYTPPGWLFVWLRRVSLASCYLLMFAIFFGLIR